MRDTIEINNLLQQIETLNGSISNLYDMPGINRESIRELQDSVTEKYNEIAILRAK